MKILHICQRDDPDTGGSLRVAEALVRAQREAGMEAWLLFLYGETGEVSKSLGSNTITLGLHSSREAVGGIGMLHKAVRRIDPDIVHSHDGIIWPRLAFIFGLVPLVMHSHLPVSVDAGLKDKVGQVLVKTTTRALIGISLHTIETWVKQKYPPSKIHYVPNGVDFDRFFVLKAPAKAQLREELGLPVDKRILLWVGRIHREMKGSDRVERIASLLPKDMVLVVVGNGPDLNGMQETCADQIAEGRVVIAGSISKPEDYYRAADQFLFTSYHEPFGLVILEAVASGLPIISFTVTHGGGAVKLLEDFNALMIEEDATDEAIQDMLATSSNRYKAAVEQRKKALGKFTWRAISSQVVEVYKIVLNKKL